MLIRTVLFVVNRPDYFISHRIKIAEKLIALGFEVHVASVSHPSSKLLKEYGCYFHDIGIERGSLNPIKAFMSILKLSKLIRKIRPTVFHCITLKPVIVGGFAAKINNVDMVSSIAGLGSVFTTNTKLNTFLRFCIKQMFKFVVFNERSKAIFQNNDDLNVFTKWNVLSREQCYLIHGSGVDLQKFKYYPHCLGDKLNILFPARLIEEKGIFEFLNSASNILSIRSDVVFNIAGDIDLGNPTSLTYSDLNHWKKVDGINFLGHVDDMYCLLSKVDIVVLPSYREGFPKALIEASAVGRAIITTDVPGCRDAVVNGETGILIEAKNSKSLEGAILAMISDPNKIIEMGKRNRLIAEQAYDVTNVVNKHIDIYQLKGSC